MKRVYSYRVVILFTVLALLAFLSLKCIGRKERRDIHLYRGKKINDFSTEIVLMDSARNIYDISNFSGSVFLLEFYDQQCKPCDDQRRMLRKISGSYMKKPLRIVWVNDGASDTFDEFSASSRGKDFLLYDERGALVRNLGITDLPAEVLVDERGVIRHFLMGWESISEKQYLEETRTRIDSLLTRKEDVQ